MHVHPPLSVASRAGVRPPTEQGCALVNPRHPEALTGLLGPRRRGRDPIEWVRHPDLEFVRGPDKVDAGRYGHPRV